LTQPYACPGWTTRARPHRQAHIIALRTWRMALADQAEGYRISKRAVREIHRGPVWASRRILCWHIGILNRSAPQAVRLAGKACRLEDGGRTGLRSRRSVLSAVELRRRVTRPVGAVARQEGRPCSTFESTYPVKRTSCPDLVDDVQSVGVRRRSSTMIPRPAMPAPTTPPSDSPPSSWTASSSP